jgi:hypothetical protein
MNPFKHPILINGFSDGIVATLEFYIRTVLEVVSQRYLLFSIHILGYFIDDDYVLLTKIIKGNTVHASMSVNIRFEIRCPRWVGTCNEVMWAK